MLLNQPYTEIFRQDFPATPNIDNLLKSLEDDPSPQTVQPSVRVLDFLKRIETADPNSCSSDDDNNECWGHYQYTSGDMQCSTVLRDWDQIGVTTALRFLAAAIKTCRVARHLCFNRGLKPTSYLSDVYLQNMVELLWESRQRTVSARVSTLIGIQISFSTFTNHRTAAQPNPADADIDNPHIHPGPTW
jgi:hypothetical protein